MRIHCLSSFVFLFGFSLIFAQTSLVGKVFSVDGDPVNGVEVHNLSRKTMVKTSQDGSFAIDISLNDDIRQIIKDSQVIIMAIDNPGQVKACQSDFVQQDISALNDCSAVFSQFLNDNNYAVSNDTSEEIKAKRQELEECFNEILAQVLIQGGQAETGTEVA